MVKTPTGNDQEPNWLKADPTENVRFKLPTTEDGDAGQSVTRVAEGLGLWLRETTLHSFYKSLGSVLRILTKITVIMTFVCKMCSRTV